MYNGAYKEGIQQTQVSTTSDTFLGSGEREQQRVLGSDSTSSGANDRGFSIDNSQSKFPNIQSEIEAGTGKANKSILPQHERIAQAATTADVHNVVKDFYNLPNNCFNRSNKIYCKNIIALRNDKIFLFVNAS